MKKDKDEYLEKEFDFSKDQASKVSIPYQTLINLYLLDCVNNKREIQMTWK